MIIDRLLIETLFRVYPLKASKMIAKAKLHEIAESFGLKEHQWLQDQFLVYFIVKSPIGQALYKVYFHANTGKEIYYNLCDTDEIWSLCTLFGLGEKGIELRDKKIASEKLIEHIKLIKYENQEVKISQGLQLA